MRICIVVERRVTALDSSRGWRLVNGWIQRKAYYLSEVRYFYQQSRIGCNAAPPCRQADRSTTQPWMVFTRDYMWEWSRRTDCGEGR